MSLPDELKKPHINARMDSLMKLGYPYCECQEGMGWTRVIFEGQSHRRIKTEWYSLTEALAQADEIAQRRAKERVTDGH